MKRKNSENGRIKDRLVAYIVVIPVTILGVAIISQSNISMNDPITGKQAFDLLIGFMLLRHGAKVIIRDFMGN